MELPEACQLCGDHKVVTSGTRIIVTFFIESEISWIPVIAAKERILSFDREHITGKVGTGWYFSEFPFEAVISLCGVCSLSGDDHVFVGVINHMIWICEEACTWISSHTITTPINIGRSMILDDHFRCETIREFYSRSRSAAIRTAVALSIAPLAWTAISIARTLVTLIASFWSHCV